MPTSSWVHLDDLRENLVFLLLGTTEQQAEPEASELLYWEVGVANANQLIETTTHYVGYDSITDETDLLVTLLDEIAEYRYSGVMLITPSTWTVQQLRRRAAVQANQQVSLRGFTHTSIEELLSEYFGQSLADYELDRSSRTAPRITEAGSRDVVSSGVIRKCWECWRQTFRLIPVDELGGTNL